MLQLHNSQIGNAAMQKVHRGRWRNVLNGNKNNHSANAWIRNCDDVKKMATIPGRRRVSPPKTNTSGRRMDGLVLNLERSICVP